MTFLEIHFRPQADTLVSVNNQLQHLFRFVEVLKRVSAEFGHWFLQGDSLQDALLYEVFDQAGPTKAALAVLNTEHKNNPKLRMIGLWNGDENETGSTLSYFYRQNSPCVIKAEFGNPAAIANPTAMQKLIVDLLPIWQPSLVQLSSLEYHDEKVFQDRPGIGWMLYLPRKLTADQVPEARALVPIMDGKKQTGTIIVSQTEEAFDAANPEHVAVANAIEVRLVDQDLLPLYTEL